MNKLSFFGITIGISIAGFLISFYLLSTYYHAEPTQTNMAEMMSRMMAGSTAQTPPTHSPTYFWVVPPMLLASLLAGLTGFTYFLIVPEIKVSKQSVPERDVTHPAEVTVTERLETLVKTMRPDEARVLTVLLSHQGKCLQKDISREAELSRLRTHRIIARFVQRNMVAVRPLGNTNEVSLSDWIKS